MWDCYLMMFRAFGEPTQKGRFMDKEVGEILRFFVVPRHAFPLSVWHGFMHILIHKYLNLSTYCLFLVTALMQHISSKLWSLTTNLHSLLKSAEVQRSTTNDKRTHFASVKCFGQSQRTIRHRGLVQIHSERERGGQKMGPNIHPIDGVEPPKIWKRGGIP